MFSYEDSRLKSIHEKLLHFFKNDVFLSDIKISSEGYVELYDIILWFNRAHNMDILPEELETIFVNQSDFIIDYDIEGQIGLVKLSPKHYKTIKIKQNRFVAISNIINNIIQFLKGPFQEKVSEETPDILEYVININDILDKQYEFVPNIYNIDLVHTIVSEKK